MSNLNTYKVSWFSMFQGTTYEEIVKAENEEEAIKKLDRSEHCTATLVEEGAEAVEHIVDAEELLMDMDANGIDEITTKEGWGGKSSRTYTREQVLKSLGLK